MASSSGAAPEAIASKVKRSVVQRIDSGLSSPSASSEVKPVSAMQRRTSSSTSTLGAAPASQNLIYFPPWLGVMPSLGQVSFGFQPNTLVPLGSRPFPQSSLGNPANGLMNPHLMPGIMRASSPPLPHPFGLYRFPASMPDPSHPQTTKPGNSSSM